MVGLATEGPGLGSVEVAVDELLYNCSARKEFVLLHTEEARNEDGVWQWVPTRRWLLPRLWTNGHHHLRMSDPIKDLVDRAPGDLDPASRSILWRSDFGRIARWISGTSIGLVLSGGGARGGAHVGAIRRMVEIGMPIDIVAGTSMGAFVGGLFAMHTDPEAVAKGYAGYCAKFMDKFAQVKDLTYPTVSLFSGESFNRLVRQHFQDVCIEDMWIPFCAVTTNITTDVPMAHLQGTAWRYVRASMTLTTFLPPLCDGPNLLVDGGYANNLPADVLKSLGPKTVIALDVGTVDNTNYTNYGTPDACPYCR